LTWYVRINGRIVGTVVAASYEAALMLGTFKFFPGLSDRIEVEARRL
jgi:hypothetical protein